MADNPDNWASYKKLLAVQPNGEISSPSGNPYPYQVMWPPEAGTNFVEVYFSNKPLQGSGYYFLGRVAPAGDRTPTSDYVKESEWKFHISVHPDDLPRAWDAIVPYLQEQNIALAKVAIPEMAKQHGVITGKSGERNMQAGKMITLYVEKSLGKEPIHTNQQWGEIINGIETRLAHAGVRPGPKVASDRAIPGAQYTHYRSEKITTAIRRANHAIRDAQEEKLLDYFEKNAREIMKTMGKEYAEPWDSAFEEAVEEFLKNPTPDLKIRLTPKKIRAVAGEFLNPKNTGLSQADIDLILPKTNGDLKSERIGLAKLLPEQRYKLPIEQDRFAFLRIGNEHTLRAERQRQVKARGLPDLPD